MPVPAPATALLARHFQSTLNDTPHEATTPTGAAYIAAVHSPRLPRFPAASPPPAHGIGPQEGLPLPTSSG